MVSNSRHTCNLTTIARDALKPYCNYIAFFSSRKVMIKDSILSLLLISCSLEADICECDGVPAERLFVGVVGLSPCGF